MRALVARLKAYFRPAGPREPAVTPPALAALEARIAALEDLNAEAVERELRWAEMNAQLRRFLGRLDAHAGRARREEEAPNGRLHARPDVIAAKFPHGLPSKE